MNSIESAPIKTVVPDQNLVKLRNQMLDLLKQHRDDVDKEGMLAVTSFIVGQLIALQDQRTMTPEVAMTLVQLNIEEGNQSLISQLLDNTAGTA
jgi:rRNA-processing protein FCF1